jgi:plasmid stabilization system protein ParE
MSLRRVYHPSAENELNEAAAFYVGCRGPGLASAFLDEVERVVRLIQAAPDGGANQGEGVQAWRLRRFPYSVIYRVLGDHVRILAIAGHKQRPQYWRGRQ